jgi:hypothetical protein
MAKCLPPMAEALVSLNVAENNSNGKRFLVLTVANMKMTAIWDKGPSSLVE